MDRASVRLIQWKTEQNSSQILQKHVFVHHSMLWTENRRCQNGWEFLISETNANIIVRWRKIEENFCTCKKNLSIHVRNFTDHCSLRYNIEMMGWGKYSLQTVKKMKKNRYIFFVNVRTTLTWDGLQKALWCFVKATMKKKMNQLIWGKSWNISSSSIFYRDEKVKTIDYCW